ncbi:hypothetical protein M441DRAFT_22549 [Trichoderma asperellum CBS 433.97]|uniref:Uncharacterized protein n=1 Tax=Trichoderma asperellum (strain ATCC 204424 / CBS 433.97 / NBRC 101777) TaxID=1042311 RepID=A0A2T3ZP24_TRIA4|nr:hypothetical protein M441DRAFT_22549 [Trichoderma asperellum CBS 433.97]PTB46542.1 hypothetical protein M441DRAFT_22549 [Trichoderma asperellum CBS 433.97]
MPTVRVPLDGEVGASWFLGPTGQSARGTSQRVIKNGLVWGSNPSFLQFPDSNMALSSGVPTVYRAWRCCLVKFIRNSPPVPSAGSLTPLSIWLPVPVPVL